MKLKINDQIIVTSGKDKGKKSKIIAVWPKLNRVTVAGANIYVRHRRKMTGRAGEIIRTERPLPTANVAILNDKGQPDRIGYLKKSDGTKVRIYKKTKTEITESKT
jgi:large subunit ribosomal protein L24